MRHGRSFAKLISGTKAKADEPLIEVTQPRSQEEVELWARLMDETQTSIIEFLEAVDLDGEPIFKIATKEIQADGTVLVPLKLWPNQRLIIETIEAEWAAGHAAKLYIPKSREHGTSFCIQAVFAERFLRGGGGDMRTVSHQQEATKALCEDFDTILSRVPSWVYTMILTGAWASRRSGAWKFVRRGQNKCVARTLTCRNKALARGERLRWVHLSEVPWWERGQREIKGALATLRDTPGNIYVFESTGRGFDDFYHGCMAAIEGKGGWRCVFLSSISHPQKLIGFDSPEERDKFIESIGTIRAYDPDDEKRWVEVGREMGLPDVPERLRWRRHMIDGVYQTDVETFRQEEALTIEDVFRADADSAFNTSILDSRRALAEREWLTWERGNFQVVGTTGDVKVEWVPDRRGKWWIKEQPVKGHTYCYGCDPASGRKVIEQGKREGDFATIVIRDITDPIRSKRKTVAVYEAHTAPEDLAVDLLATSKFYGWARGYPERNNDGKVLLSVNCLPLLQERWDAPVDTILCQMKLVISTGHRLWEPTLGFWSDQASKHAAVSRMKSWLRELGPLVPGGEAMIPYPILKQMRLYQVLQKNDLKTGGTTGVISYGCTTGHDDLVTAMYLALEAEEWLDRPENENERTRVEENDQTRYNQAMLAKARRELGFEDERVEPSRIWQPAGTYLKGTREKREDAVDPTMGVFFA